MNVTNLEDSQINSDFIADSFITDESDTEENQLTLTPKDYDRWMPVIDLEEKKKSGWKFFDDICSICLDTIQNGEKVRQISTC